MPLAATAFAGRPHAAARSGWLAAEPTGTSTVGPSNTVATGSTAGSTRTTAHATAAATCSAPICSAPITGTGLAPVSSLVVPAPGTSTNTGEPKAVKSTTAAAPHRVSGPGRDWDRETASGAVADTNRPVVRVAATTVVAASTCSSASTG